MFDHVKFGVSDYAASKAFFLKALEPLGVAVVQEGPPTYGVELSPKGKASLCLYQTEEKPAHLHLAFTAENRQQVEAFYRAAMEAGGKDNGAPGLCPDTTELLCSFRHWSGRAQHRSGLPPIRGLTKRRHRRAAFRRNSLTRIAPHRADQSTLLFSRAGVPDKSFPHKPCLSQLVRRCGLLPIAQPARHLLIGYAESPHVTLLNRPDSSPR